MYSYQNDLLLPPQPPLAVLTFLFSFKKKYGLLWSVVVWASVVISQHIFPPVLFHSLFPVHQDLITTFLLLGVCVSPRLHELLMSTRRLNEIPSENSGSDQFYPTSSGWVFRTSTPVQTKQTLTGSTPVYDAGSTTRAPSSTGEMGLEMKDSRNTALPSEKERFWVFEE